MAGGTIRVEGLSKGFRIHAEPARSVKELALRFVKRKLDYEEFWALRDVSLGVDAGESVGIIGRNGSGKSTLFKLISGVFAPTSGSVRASGRIAPMIELTAGFHPELTGMENIFLNCAIYGLGRAEAEAKLGRITGFADIGDFIHSPVRMYSSGMMARLGFAVAVNVDADILLVDEVLAVGDEQFQQRCYERIKNLKKDGVTIVYVSHNLESVRDLCGRVIWLDNGTVVADGRPDGVIDEYRRSVGRG